MTTDGNEPGTVPLGVWLWLPDGLADPANPTAAELAAGIVLTPNKTEADLEGEGSGHGDQAST